MSETATVLQFPRTDEVDVEDLKNDLLLAAANYATVLSIATDEHTESKPTHKCVSVAAFSISRIVEMAQALRSFKQSVK